ncbi:hypothetical protein [Lutibacter sp.]|uniref:hypothetical protein n=1 Tax=Lutibacter sp. TaxID=1925666 RepID=UPI001A1D235C|nr:hypothetical protein [Lutibacter sp.]MBI9039965.1 hypothetical protein [Lutibacter sp.]
MPPKVVLEALKNAVNHKEYSSVQGDLELRKNISQFHEAHNGLKVNCPNVIQGIDDICDCISNL